MNTSETEEEKLNRMEKEAEDLGHIPRRDSMPRSPVLEERRAPRGEFRKRKKSCAARLQHDTDEDLDKSIIELDVSDREIKKKRTERQEEEKIKKIAAARSEIVKATNKYLSNKIHFIKEDQATVREQLDVIVDEVNGIIYEAGKATGRRIQQEEQEKGDIKKILGSIVKELKELRRENMGLSEQTVENGTELASIREENRELKEKLNENGRKLEDMTKVIKDVEKENEELKKQVKEDSKERKKQLEELMERMQGEHKEGSSKGPDRRGSRQEKVVGKRGVYEARQGSSREGGEQRDREIMLVVDGEACTGLLVINGPPLYLVYLKIYKKIINTKVLWILLNFQKNITSKTFEHRLYVKWHTTLVFQMAHPVYYFFVL